MLSPCTPNAIDLILSRLTIPSADGAHDGKRKELAKVYGELVAKIQGRRLIRKQATVTLEFSLLGLYTCRSYQDRMWDEVHEVLQSGETPDFRFI